MLLGFKAQFAQYVQEGSKTHTIRGFRVNQPKVGDIAHCYTGLRQRGPIIQKLASGEVVREKKARLLGRFPIVKIEAVDIWIHLGLIEIGIHESSASEPRLLDKSEASELAWRDGFREDGRDLSLVHMAKFWMANHPTDRLTANNVWHGQIIHWRHQK